MRRRPERNKRTPRHTEPTLRFSKGPSYYSIVLGLGEGVPSGEGFSGCRLFSQELVARQISAKRVNEWLDLPHPNPLPSGEGAWQPALTLSKGPSRYNVVLGLNAALNAS